MTRRREQGFTLVEMMVVLLLIAIVLAIGFTSIRSTSRTGSHAAAVATANSYARAVDRFAAAHGGRVPTIGTDWPTEGQDALKGPVARIMGERKYYLRSVPEAMIDRTVLGVGAVPTNAQGSQSSITYMIDGAGYRIEVRTPDRPVCAVYGLGGSFSGGDEPKACGNA